MSPIAEPVKEWLPEWVEPYLPTRQERGKYTGPLSTFSEYHALGVGFALGPEFSGVAAAYAAGSGGGKLRRSGHIRDAMQEVGYTGLGIGLRMAAMGLLF